MPFPKSFAKPFATGTTLGLMLALSACGGSDEPDVNALDAAISGNAANEADPALTSALSDQIMVDPALAQQSNRNAIRAPDGPASAPIPPDAAPGGAPPPATGALHAPDPTPAEEAADGATTLGALAAAQASGKLRGLAANCTAGLKFSAGWATKLPEALPVYPGGRVTEGAGNDAAGCGTRVVSFVSDAPLQTVIDWYYTRVVQAGYSSQHKLSGSDHILAGTRSRDDSAYYLIVANKAGRTEVDVIAAAGM